MMKKQDKKEAVVGETVAGLAAMVKGHKKQVQSAIEWQQSRARVLKKGKYQFFKARFGLTLASQCSHITHHS